MHYQAVMFDLDGTLVNSLTDLGESANRMLAHYGYAQHAIEKYRLMVGNGMRVLMQRCLPTDASPDLIDEALRTFQQIYAERFSLATYPYDGIAELLTSLKDQGIPLAICTNKEHRAATQIVNRLFPADTFTYVLGEREGIPHKPDPTAVLEIAANLHLAPHTIVYMGDSGVDMQTAVAASMLPVGALWGFRTREELIAHGGQIMLEHPLELLNKVEFASLK